MRRNSWLCWQLVLLLGIADGALRAALASQFLVKGFTAEEGLPQNVVFSIAQTREGYLWLGTGNGLARFDGVHFKTFDEDQAAELAGAKILKLFEDSGGHLWVATDNAG